MQVAGISGDLETTPTALVLRRLQSNVVFALYLKKKKKKKKTDTLRSYCKAFTR